MKFAIELCCNITSENKSDELNRTARDLQVLCSKCVESESANDDGSKLIQLLALLTSN